MTADHDDMGDDGDQDGDNGYEEAMKRLAVLKGMPVESLSDAQRKEKLYGVHLSVMHSRTCLNLIYYLLMD